MQKSNVKNIFHIPCWLVLSECQQAKTRGTLVRGVSLIAQSLTAHASTPPAVGAAKHHSQKAYLTSWQQCSVSTSEAILTTKYGFNLRQNSPLNIENNTGYSGWIPVSVAHALIGPQSLKLAHFWSDIRWFTQFRSFCCLNATVPTSPPGDHSQVESPARGYCAKNSAYVNKAG